MVAAATVVLILALALGSAICWHRRPAGRLGGTLTLAVPAGLLVADPHRSAHPHPGLFALYDTLVVRDAQGRWEAGLAASWHIGAGGRQITLRLRDGMRFHDGLPVDGAAVKQTLERILSGGDQEFPVARLLGRVTGVQAEGLTVTIQYAEPFPPVWWALSDPRLAVISPRALAGGASSGFAVPPPGTGPYRWSGQEDGAWLLERNRAYSWPPPSMRNRGAAYPDRFRLVGWPGGGDTAALDGIWWPPGEAGPSLPAGREDQPWSSYRFAGTRLLYLVPVLAVAPFDDPMVRQALSLALDRLPVTALAPSPSLPSGSLLAPWRPSLPDAPAPERLAAASLLQRAGWLPGPDGIRRKGDAVLEVRLATYEDDPAYQALGEEVAAQWRAVGAQVRLVPPRRHLVPGRVIGEPNAWLLALQWPDPDVLYYLFHSGQIGRANRAAVASPDLDALLEQTRLAADPVQRAGWFDRVEAWLLGQAAVFPLAVERGELLLSGRVGGWRAQAGGDVRLQDLYLKPGR